MVEQGLAIVVEGGEERTLRGERDGVGEGHCGLGEEVLFRWTWIEVTVRGLLSRINGPS